MRFQQRGRDLSEIELQQMSPSDHSIARGLARVGDAWGALLLRDACRGSTRFEQFRTGLGIAPNILSRRLKALTKAGLLTKVRYSQRPPRDEYVLTAAGRDFIPVLEAIGVWADAHYYDETLNLPKTAENL